MKKSEKGAVSSALIVSVVLVSLVTFIGRAQSQNAVGDRRNPRAGGTRSVVRAMNGMIATSQPLASAAGLRILQQGGNAVDAAVAAAAVLCVVEPMMVSPGGDLFALVWDAKKKELKALNSSGRSPKALTISALKAKGINQMPSAGIQAVTVPGAVEGWAQLLKRNGTMTLAQVLAPAIDVAERGFPVSEVIGNDWNKSGLPLIDSRDFAHTYLPGGRAPAIGEVFRNPNLAATLKLIANGGPDVFYRGELAAKIVKFAQAQGGFHTLEDFASHRSNWIDPISTTYRDNLVYELPPNTQGLSALEMLNILEGFDMRSMGHNSASYIHTIVEAKKLAFVDRARHIADPDFYQAPLSDLLSKKYAADLRARIDRSHAVDRDNRAPGGEDTVYLTVVDRDRNVVSLIQSIFNEFGSGLVAGDTGIILHNRGAGFSFDEKNPNRLEGNKRPFHTLIPAMVFRDGRPWLSFGVMGGDMQAQGHVQVLLNLIDFGMDVQQAGEQPRIRHFDRGLAMESAIGADVRRQLEQMGHQMTDAPGSFGGYQAIMIDPKSGALAGGSDPRKDGCAMGW